jgi:type III secretion protein J
MALVLPGCDEVQLYSNVPERDVNEMMAVLLQKGIAATKETGSEGTWTLTVPSDAFSEAVRVLNAMGFPRTKAEGLGETFKKSGLISSPSEERIRFMAALAHELEATLAQFEGVVAARVHIVLPENDPLGEKLNPSRASVFIRHLEDADIESRVDEVKNLVVNSIEGLEREKVAVYLSPTPRPPPGPATSRPASLAAPPGRFAGPWDGQGRPPAWLLAGAGALVAMNLGTWGILALHGRGRNRDRSAGSAMAAISPAATSGRTPPSGK